MPHRIHVLLLAVAAVVPAVRAQSPTALAEHEVIGSGTPGAPGVPTLRLVGRAAVGEPGPGLRIEHAHPGARAILIVGPGVGNLPLPWLGATLYCELPAARIAVGLIDAHGSSPLLHSGPAAVPAALAGLDFVAQGLVYDSAAQGGKAFTAGLRLRPGAGFAAPGLFAGLGYRLRPEQGSQVDEVVAAGDFDENGRRDLVTVTRLGSSRAITLLRQLDDGSFAPPFTHLLGVGIVPDLLTADLDGDAHADLITSEYESDQHSCLVRLLHGLGDGTFGSESTIAVPATSQPASLALGDLTGDGVVDLAVSEWGQGALAILPGFTGPPQVRTLPGTSVPGTLRAVDLDGDTVVDLALLIDSPVQALAVFRGLGGGSFAPFQVTPISTDDVLSLALGDVDGDGDLDAVAGMQASFGPVPRPTLAVLFNDGNDLFSTTASPPPEWFTGGSVTDLELADLDEDQDLDLVVGHRSPGVSFQNKFLQIVVCRNVGGAFVEPHSPLASATELVLEDFDGDGRADIAGVTNAFLDAPRAALWRGLGNADFDSPPDLPGLESWSTDVGDTDGDGDLDVVVVVSGEPPGPLQLVAVSLWSDATGFATPVTFDAGGSSSLYDALDLGDADGDGDLDALVAGGGTLRLLRGDGHGALSPPEPFAVTLPRTPRIADVDADGAADLVVSSASSGQGMLVLRADGAGGFLPAMATPAVPSDGLFLYQLGDLDDDGLLDVVAQGVDGFHLFLGTGGGRFAASFVPDPGTYESEEFPLALGDLDDDGDLDLARSDYTLHLTTWLNDGHAGFIRHQVMLAGAPIRLSLADVNGDGALDVLGADLTLGFGDGTLSTGHPNFTGGAMGDFDSDGDVDVVMAGHFFENRLH